MAANSINLIRAQPILARVSLFSPASPDEIATKIRSVKPKKSNRENDMKQIF